MNEAAERYSPEIAEAFQPTETERPATKKSCAVLDFRADQKPIQMVARTVTTEKVRIQGSRCIGYIVMRFTSLKRPSAKPEASFADLIRQVLLKQLHSSMSYL